MSEDEINKAIAKICGWKNLAFDVWHNGTVGVLPTNKDVRSKIPNYCNDLNAMHEAEKFLFLKKMAHRYFLHLADFWKGNQSDYYFHSTARQRAEAFLRTLGKWEEAK